MVKFVLGEETGDAGFTADGRVSKGNEGFESSYLLTESDGNKSSGVGGLGGAESSGFSLLDSLYRFSRSSKSRLLLELDDLDFVLTLELDPFKREGSFL